MQKAPNNTKSKSKSKFKPKSRRGRRSRRRSYTDTESEYDTESEIESSSASEDSSADEADLQVFTPAPKDEQSAYRVFANGMDSASWSLPTSVKAATLGPANPGVPENPWPGPYQGGPSPTPHPQDSRFVNGGQPLGAELAGSFTDPNTGIVYAAYTDRMPEPKVLRDVPDANLGKPNRMLEALTGVSSVPRPCRQEMVNDFQDAVEGLQLPQGLLEMQIRNETEQRDARELFFTNREVEAGHNDTHWDGYIGTTYVLRPTYDTQTLRDNSESNTTELPFRQNGDGNLAIPMFRAPTEWGGDMQPSVEILAQDRAYGLPHLHSEYQVDGARFQQHTDSLMPTTELLNNSRRATMDAHGSAAGGGGVGLPWERGFSTVSDRAHVDRTVTGAATVAPVLSDSQTLVAAGMAPRRDSAWAASDAQLATSQTHTLHAPTLNMANLLAATADASAKDAAYVNYYASAASATTSSAPSFITDASKHRDSEVVAAHGGNVITSSQAPSMPFLTSEYANTQDSHVSEHTSRRPDVHHSHHASLQPLTSSYAKDAQIQPRVATTSQLPDSSVLAPTSDMLRARDAAVLSHIIHSSTSDVGNSTPALHAVYTGLLATPERVSTGASRNLQAMPVASAVPVVSVSATTNDSMFHTTLGASDAGLRQQQQASLQAFPRDRATQADSRVAATAHSHGFGTASENGGLSYLPGTMQRDVTRIATETGVQRVDPTFGFFEANPGILPSSSEFSKQKGMQPGTLRASSSLPFEDNGRVTSAPVSVSDAITHGEGFSVGAARSSVYAQSGPLSPAVSMAASAPEYAGRETVASMRVTPQALEPSAMHAVPASAPEYAGRETVAAMRVTPQALGASASEPSATHAAAAVATQYARDSWVGANTQHAEVLQGDFAQPTSLPVAVRDSAHTETPMVPGRVGNSRVLAWTGQSLVAEAVPIYIQDPDKGDAMHAQDKYMTHERVIREELEHANAGKTPAGFRNEYETTGRRRDETNVWRGRKNGPSAGIIAALLENQLYELSSRNAAAEVMEATRVAYDSDVG